MPADSETLDSKMHATVHVITSQSEIGTSSSIDPSNAEAKPKELEVQLSLPLDPSNAEFKPDESEVKLSSWLNPSNVEVKPEHFAGKPSEIEIIDTSSLLNPSNGELKTEKSEHYTGLLSDVEVIDTSSLLNPSNGELKTEKSEHFVCKPSDIEVIDTSSSLNPSNVEVKWKESDHFVGKPSDIEIMDASSLFKPGIVELKMEKSEHFLGISSDFEGIDMSSLNNPSNVEVKPGESEHFSGGSSDVEIIEVVSNGKSKETSKNKRKYYKMCNSPLRKSPRVSELPVEPTMKKCLKKDSEKVRVENGNGDCNGVVAIKVKIESECSFVGEPVSEEEAKRRWGWRYELKNQKANQQCGKLNAGDEDEIILNVKCHYTQARVSNRIINLGDCAFIKGDGVGKHVGKILEFFQTTDEEDYFRVQWFYRAEDTVLQKQAALHDKKRLFYSTVMNDNLLDCIISKVRVAELAPTLNSKLRCTSSDFYYDMEYCVEYSTFRNLRRDDSLKSSELFAPGVSEVLKAIITSTPLETSPPLEVLPSREPYKSELALLDLYSGCGGMSTGLCLGARLSSVNLVTRWAVDANQAACDSLKLNHPETLVRKQNAEDFLELLKEWEKLCQRYVLKNLNKSLRSRVEDANKAKGNVKSSSDVKKSAGEYEVQRLVDISYGDPDKTRKRGIYFKVRWLGYSSSDDTWEPMESLSNCQERIEDFVKGGYKSKVLPLPGDVDVLCGGPPCQGISGYNRHRNVVSPLTDEKNRQLIVFMDIVKYLRPKYVLMENVNDILKFDKASLGRYALSRLIDMKYQARLGSMASGCYGLPQFRLRVFLWGALPSEKLPHFPLPSHDVVVKYWPATEFERNTVAYDEGQHRDLEEALVLRDAISDLQAVTSQETRDEMLYELPPDTEFQKYIRLTKDAMLGISGEPSDDAQNAVLYDHRPLPLTDDDKLRVAVIPHKKGANFRDLPGLIIGSDNVVNRDPKNEVKMPSGKLWVPDSSINFEHGKSKRPYARVWWDETVATIVTYPNIRAQAVLHPDQDRVFTIREFARLQGFPDYYRFCGSVKERYCQVGNAVSVPVSRALGYCLGLAIRKVGGDEPLVTLPPKFAFQRTPAAENTM